MNPETFAEMVFQNVAFYGGWLLVGFVGLYLVKCAIQLGSMLRSIHQFARVYAFRKEEEK